MPEGPEVKNITDYLNSALAGLTLVNLCWDEKSKFALDGLDNIENIRSHFPAKMEQVFCKGKQIFFQLISIKYQSRFYFNSGLGMAGGWVVKKGTHSNLWLEFGEITKMGEISLTTISSRIYFDDKRHFGNFTILWADEAFKKRWSEIGPDMLSGQVTFPVWTQILNRHKRCSLVSLLMNQAYLSGIGNYLKAEILYRARLKPDRKVGSLSSFEMGNLWKHSMETIQESYLANGLMIKDYKEPLGRKGTFTIRIYGKTHDPLGNPVVTAKFADSRTTHWVPALQI